MILFLRFYDVRLNKHEKLRVKAILRSDHSETTCVRIQDAAIKARSYFHQPLAYDNLLKQNYTCPLRKN